LQRKIKEINAKRRTIAQKCAVPSIERDDEESDKAGMIQYDPRRHFHFHRGHFSTKFNKRRFELTTK
jgi:hypothetical protein